MRKRPEVKANGLTGTPPCPGNPPRRAIPAHGVADASRFIGTSCNRLPRQSLPHRSQFPRSRMLGFVHTGAVRHLVHTPPIPLCHVQPQVKSYGCGGRFAHARMPAKHVTVRATHGYGVDAAFRTPTKGRAAPEEDRLFLAVGPPRKAGVDRREPSRTVQLQYGQIRRPPALHGGQASARSQKLF